VYDEVCGCVVEASCPLQSTDGTAADMMLLLLLLMMMMMIKH